MFSVTFQPDKIKPFNKKVIPFRGESSKKPLAVFCDIFEYKNLDNATDLVPVKDWNVNKEVNHGFLTTAVARATNESADIKAYDFMEGIDIGDSIYQITQVINEAIKIKQQNPEKPVYINLSLSINLYNKDEASSGEELAAKLFKVNPGYQEAFDDFNKTVTKFLSLPDTRIFIAAGNEREEYNLLLLRDQKNLIGVYGTDATKSKLPFFTTNPYGKTQERAIFNVYENNKSGERYFVVNNKKIVLDYDDTYETRDGETKTFRVPFPYIRTGITPTKENINTILGQDLQGRPFDEVKKHLLPINCIVNESVNPDYELTKAQQQYLDHYRRDFAQLDDYQKAYIESKKDFYLPVDIDTRFRIRSQRSDLEVYFIDKNACLFFNVDKEGITYWTPDGSPRRKGSKVVGFIKGTSFATPIAMMKDLRKYTKAGSKVSFSGKIILKPQLPKKVFYV